MKTKHTPGPWKTTNHGAQINVSAEIRDTIDGRAYPPMDMMIAHVEWGGSQIGKANARLIALAPDLLALCHSLAQELANEINVPLDKCIGGPFSEYRRVLAKLDGGK